MGDAMVDIGRFLIVAGLVVLAAGVLWPVIARVDFGRLPGDIVIERRSMTLYLPLATGLVVSIVLSLLLWLLAR
ncbi:MAG TPA: DUF2905 domain-containing protein [Xanthobacteraceae bacterium]|nr:DUF2905 domain-containing protein [Xanthobacteraceae bacterium]